MPPPDPRLRAEALAHELIILDGHVDVPWRMEEAREAGKPPDDVTRATEGGDFDLLRARAGGLDAPFMSIYVAPRFEGKGAKAVADRLIDSVEAIVARAPDDFALARSPAELRANFAAGKISLPMGMENGAPIEGDLANVAYFHGRGIRYITLAHSKDNHISDSSYDDRHTHGGLSPFGEQVVAEMNRVGIMVDVSHLSDEAFDDVLRVSQAPVIASHSSCRHFTPGWERNMSDEMIRRLAAAGGVIQINFGSDFLSGELRAERKAWRAELDAHLKAQGVAEDTPEGEAAAAAWSADHPAPRATVETVADHIEHVISLVGVDHVGLGSDFDGVGDSLPQGLEDVSRYPNLLRVLLERGHGRDELEGIAGGNVLRVWQAVEDHAHAAQRATTKDPAAHR
ncbi:MAG: membrane dipeptidase [Myxococcales bacterium]|nr:dipeptidase [Myxococcales bacterium]MCB9717051.1 membrane dipeptidase [Myxococcales bacterium]